MTSAMCTFANSVLVTDVVEANTMPFANAVVNQYY
jgi:hypothetical protein